MALLLLPLPLQAFGTHFVRTADTCLQDLGYVAFYAVGACLFALLASPHLGDNFMAIAALFPAGLHSPWWITIALAAVFAAFFGTLLGIPTLKLRGDYLAIVSLGFGEIVRILIINLGHPVNITDGAKGLGLIDSVRIFDVDLGRTWHVGGYQLASVKLCCYLFLVLVVLTGILCLRLQNSHIGRAWMAIRDDEVAVEALGINTCNMKLLAFAIGASFGGVAGALFATFQGFTSPEAFSLQESVMIVAMVVFGGLGHVPGVILGAVLLTAFPELFRYGVGPLQAMTDGRLDAGILRQLLIALAMIVTMPLRPRGLWPAPEHGKSLRSDAENANASTNRAPRPAA